MRSLLNVEIDYEPTDALVERPLDPTEHPWLKAKQISLTALWTPEDLARFVRHAAREHGAHVYAATHATPPLAVDPSDALRPAPTGAWYAILLTDQALEVPRPSRLREEVAHTRPAASRDDQRGRLPIRRHRGQVGIEGHRCAGREAGVHWTIDDRRSARGKRGAVRELHG